MSHTLSNRNPGLRRSPRSRRLSAVERLVLIAVAVGLIIAAALSGTSRAQVETTRVKVETGASLWALAAEYGVEGLTTEQNVDLIASLNGLESMNLPAGTSISVPIAEAGNTPVAMR